MSEEAKCRNCGKLKLDHKRGFYGRRFCDDEETLFEPAERVIEVAPQGEIPGTVGWWTSEKPLVDRLHYYAAVRGTAETALFVPDDILEILAMLSNSEASLTAAREERDRARDALREIYGQVVNGRLCYFGDSTGYTPQIGSHQVEQWAKILGLSKPVSDRQPEGDTK